MGHGGHSHSRPIGEGEEVPVAEPRVARVLWSVIGAIVALTVIAMIVMWPSGDRFGADTSTFADDTVHARVEPIEFASCSFDTTAPCRVVTGAVTDGECSGQVFTIERAAGVSASNG